MILRALGLTSLREGPIRHLVTIAGVAIGVASVVSTLCANRAAVAFLSSDVEEIAGRARIEVRRPGGVRIEDLEELRPFCAELVVAPLVEELVLCPRLDDLVRLVGIDPFVDDAVRELGLGLRAAGDADSGLGPSFEKFLLGPGVAVSSGLAAQLGLQVGDPLELVVRARPVELELVAVFEPPRFASVWDRVVVCDVALAQELTGRTDRLDRVELTPREGAFASEGQAELEATAQRLREALPAGCVVGSASQRKNQGERMVRALEFNLTALSGVSILVGIVLVATTLATSVVQRKKRIALLRSLGASRAQVAGAVLFEAGAIGAIGGVLGVAGGYFGARAALAGVRTSVATIAQGTATGRVELAAAGVAGGIALGVGAALVAALLPLREALSTPPIQGLAGARPESILERRFGARLATFAGLVALAWVFTLLPPIEDRPIWALAAALCLLSTLFVVAAPLVDLGCALHGRRGLGQRPALRVAQAALEAGRGRAAWAAGAVGIAVALAVAMATMVGSFRETVVAWTEQTLGSDLFVRPLATASGMRGDTLDPEIARIAERVFGPESVDPYHETTAELAGREYTLAGAAFHVVAREGGVPFLDGRPARTVFAEAVERGGAVVNEPFERRFGLGRGDTLSVETPDGRVEREIVGVFRDYSGHTGRAVLDRADFLALFPDGGPRSLAIFVTEGADVDSARRAFRAALGDRFAVETLSNREVKAEVLEVFERTFAVTIALQLISSIVAAIAVVTVLGALVRERRRELAILRVLGGSERQVAGVVVGEALILAGAGALGGLVAGLAVGWVLVAVVNLQSFGWTLSFQPPWRSLFLTAGATLPACLLAALPPVLAALRASPREALHELG